MSAEPPEIIFVRRSLHRRADEPQHGVWKIAYADFMTAMMAFFLVMWLINATDQKTREAVASYFNPIKLAEATVDKKGLRDPLETEKEGIPDGKDQRAAMESVDDSLEGYSQTLDRPHERKPRYSEAALFEDPYAVLAALVAGSEPDQLADNVGAFETLGQSGEPGLNGGDAQRDPFDPVYWKMSRTPAPGDGEETGGTDVVDDKTEGKPILSQLAATDPAPVAEAELENTPPLPPAKPPVASPAPSQELAVASAALPAPPPAEAKSGEDNQLVAPLAAPEETATASLENTTESAPDKPVAATSTEQSEAAKAKMGGDAKALDRDIHTAIGNIGPTPGIEVTAAPEGLLVTLMDERKFGMFAVGSAEPEPELIRTIDAIGKLIGERPGKIVVRGHTDARPFRSKDYDNWRLSTARAHMAYYMLVRGGVPETRFEKIEGYADHWLKNTGDPEAPENRRIEILIREMPT
ncbi:MotB family protein [Pleomorphomonas sp. JP5]|uniref:MotB family protein n=1 Tax=Pleomorphomonas sp. JP5 TaxID=2942998 RepID=UPI0020436291|nr:MotB family protein [Pleomorphomonas sp. JP5]MCM5560414.1 MotB family protein [Pleomorphomonas sp. JP5]